MLLREAAWRIPVISKRILNTYICKSIFNILRPRICTNLAILPKEWPRDSHEPISIVVGSILGIA